MFPKPLGGQSYGTQLHAWSDLPPATTETAGSLYPFPGLELDETSLARLP